MAKRAKKSVIEQDQQPPADPREVFDKHMALLRPLQKTLRETTDARRTANSAWRTALKAAKKEGIDTDALTAALAYQAADPEDVTKKFTNINRYLVWLGAAVGTQLGLFGPGLTVASAAEAEQFDKQPISTEASVREARTKGFDAGSDGKNLSDNPHEDGSPEFLAWGGGYRDAQAKLARKLGRGKNGAETHASA